MGLYMRPLGKFVETVIKDRMSDYLGPYKLPRRVNVASKKGSPILQSSWSFLKGVSKYLDEDIHVDPICLDF